MLMKVGYSRKLVVAVRESQSAATSMVTFPSGVYALYWVPSMVILIVSLLAQIYDVGNSVAQSLIFIT